MSHWTAREHSRDAAAAALAINLNTLDQWLLKYKAPSGKRGASRVFSVRDLTVLQVARYILSPGILAIDAIAIAVRNVTDPPDMDDVIFVTPTRQWAGRRDDPWPPQSCAIVPIGIIKNSIETSLAAHPSHPPKGTP